jgi:hypothetical protein
MAPVFASYFIPFATVCPSFDRSRNSTGKGKPMFLIRTAFWLTLVILLLPTSEAEQRAVYGTAEAAVEDVRTFCTRNPDVCAKSRDAFEVFTQKAKFGAQMLMDFVADASADNVQDTGDAVERQRFPALFRNDPQNTLTADDREPSWFGPSSKSGV